MPVSNGQVGRYDIRREAVHSDHIIDDAVITAKIPDLAVTFPDKIDDPTWTLAWETEPWDGATIDTTQTEHTSATIDVPAWVDAVSILAIATLQASNVSGSTQNFTVYLQIDGSAQGGRTITVPNNSTGAVDDVEVRNLVGVAGSSFDIGVFAFSNGGSHTFNFGRAWGIAVGGRG
jgi:hypothetical protein